MFTLEITEERLMADALVSKGLKGEASVAGFIPATSPQFVILVKIDRPQKTIYGGTAAAPLWKAIAQQLMWYYHVPPDAV